MPSNTSLDVSFLDQLQFRDLYFSDGKIPKIRLYAENINCSKCIQKIESIKDENLQNISAFLNNNTIEISLINQTAAVTPIIQKIKKMGFNIHPLEKQSTSEKLSMINFRKDLIRLAVVGTCAGQIMTLALSEYFGLPVDLKPFFNWVSFGLYLPILTYGAWPFYQKFFTDLINKKVSIDSTMTLASLLGFSISSYNL
jgi:Cu2+-exporting ATPase/Cu+-exporting ATPase